MAFVRKFVILAILAGFVGAPVLRAAADEGSSYSERTPAAAKHKKKKKKKSKKAKKHAAKAKHHASHSGKSKSHAPKTASTMPSAPEYPTQPNAGMPEQKGADLPPPSTPNE